MDVLWSSMIMEFNHKYNWINKRITYRFGLLVICILQFSWNVAGNLTVPYNQLVKGKNIEIIYNIKFSLESCNSSFIYSLQCLTSILPINLYYLKVNSIIFVHISLKGFFFCLV